MGKGGSSACHIDCSRRRSQHTSSMSRWLGVFTARACGALSINCTSCSLSLISTIMFISAN